MKDVVTICVAVCPLGSTDIIDEFETINEARKCYPSSQFDFWYLAAEVINEDGDVNPACWGRTKKEALMKLKKALKV